MINFSTPSMKLFCRTRRGTKAGRRDVRSFCTVVSYNRDSIPKQKRHGVNVNNLSHLTFKTSALQNTPNQSILSSILTIPSITRPPLPQNKLTTVPNLLNLTKIQTESKTAVTNVYHYHH